MGSSQPHSISVVVPLYNEIELVRSSLRELTDFFSLEFEEFEILVVESGSTDGSAAAADEFASQTSRVRVIHEGVRRGFGSAVRRGFSESTGDFVVVVTVDRPFPLDSILVAVQTIADQDAVLSYRSDDGRGFARRFQSHVYNLLARALLGLPVRHVNSALKLYRRSVLASLDLVVNDWFIDTEIVYRLHSGRYRFSVIPAPLVERNAGTSTVTLGTALELFRDLIFFAWKERLRPRTNRMRDLHRG